MHNHYAAMNNLVFVAFMYGVCMPILYPLCVFGLTVQYVVDKLRMAYVYRKPPMYDGKLNSITIKFLSIVPLFTIALTFW